MTRYLVGGEMDAFTPSDGGVYESTQAGSFDPAFARCSVFVTGNDTSYAEGNHASLTTYHLRFDRFTLGKPPLTHEYGFLSLYNSVGTKVFKITQRGDNDALSATTILTSYIWTGSAFLQVGATFIINSANTVRNTYNIKLIPTTGEYQIYVNGTLRDSGTGSTFTNVAKVHLEGGYYPGYWSQVIVSDVSEIGNNVKTIVPTGAGANTAWTGSFGDVDEIVYSDADFIYSTTNGDKETYTNAALDLSTYTVQAIAVSERGNCGATGPQNAQLVLVSGATTATSASIPQGPGYAVSQHIWETDPNTSASWLSANAQAVEFGVKAIT